MDKYKKNIRYLIASIVFALAAVFIQEYQSKPDSYKIDTKEFSRILYQKEDKIAGYLNDVFNKSSLYIDSSKTDLFEINKQVDFKELSDNGLTLAVFLNDSLRFWTDNSIDLPVKYSESTLNNNVLRLNNAWFLVKHIHAKNIDVIGLILLKHQYSFENEYLKNNFQKDFKLLPSVKVSLVSLSYSFDINDRQGNFLFSLVPVNTIFSSSINWQLIGVLYFLSLVFILLFLIKWFRKIRLQQSNAANIILLVSAFILFARYLMLEFKYPFQIYSLDFFDPGYFAVSYFFPSLGDFLINALLILFFTLSLFIVFRKGKFVRKFKQKSKILKQLTAFFAFTVLIAFFNLIMFSIKSLIFNSSIPLEAYKILEINILSITAYFIIAVLIASFVILFDQISFIGKQLTQKGTFVALFLSASIVFYAIAFFAKIDLPVSALPFLLALFLVFYYIYFLSKKHHYYFYIIMIMISSAFVVLFTNAELQQKEQNKAKILISKLQTERDLVVEHLLSKLEKKIKEDKTLKQLVDKQTKQQLDLIYNYLINKYFKGYFKKYDLDILLCSDADGFDKNNQLRYCADYYAKQVDKYGKKLPTSDFYYMDNHNGRVSYFGAINYNDTTPRYSLYIMLDSKLSTGEIGYPDLLIEGKIKSSDNLNKYAYAKYSSGELKSRFGNFPYDLNDKMFAKLPVGYSMTTIGNYNHFIYKTNDHNLIVLSKTKTKTIDLVIAFSYVFVFFNLLLLISLAIINLHSLLYQAQLNFENKLLMSMIFVLTLSFLMVGAGTVYYNMQQFEKNNNKNITEKLESVVKDIQLDTILLDSQDSLHYKQYLNNLLRKQADVFYTDINLYNLQGKLIASSRPEIFTKGLIGNLMNPEAYRQMRINEKVQYIQQEHIGNLEYTSAYALYRDTNNQKLAYINLPYFTKPGALRKEISNLIVAVINMFVVLFIIAGAVAFFMSNKITQPLRMLQNKFMDVELGKQSEQIYYDKKDEIGALVNEYNRMVLKLAENVELLAKTERESAWREMAKQVAHEIKNPLTPMKLSVQFLQRSWKDKDENFEKKMEKYTQALIDQINTLSNIANEFSSFAKMPKPQNQSVNLVEKLENTVNLFSHNDNVNISIDLNRITELKITADKEQISRVFNNLIKNAIQAIPSDREGKIEVILQHINDKALIIIKDNGGGISDEQKDKLFIPNFTTKSTGMGLGLPMVKQIVESIDGKIWFESKLNIGTEFYIELPVIN